MFSFLHLPIKDTPSLNSVTNRHLLLTNVLAMNANTTKLQNLLISNVEPVNLNNDNYLNKYISCNKVIGKIFKQYWKEYIYITPHNLASNNFEDLISRYYLIQSANSVNKNKTHIDVKQYLATKKIKVLYSSELSSFNKPRSVKYASKKYVNRLHTDLLKLFRHLSQKLLFSSQFNNATALLNMQKLPVFIIVNCSGEMIIGEPDHTINAQEIISDPVPNITALKNNYQFPLREGYVFINPKDAIEYFNYLEDQYPHSFSEMKVKVFVGTLKNFYKQNKKQIGNIQLRLVPDLKEVGKLITAYQYSANIHFNPKQIYGKDYFQGQPIYLMDPVMCIYTDKSTGKVHKCYFPNLLALNKKEYFNIFTTYKDALLVWRQYRKRFGQYILPKQPKLTVYNLESFLKEYNPSTSTFEGTNKSFRLVPSYEVYSYMKSIQKLKHSKSFKNAPRPDHFLASFKMWTNRILWGMVKWYPPEK